jgi:hypothetical protein
MKEALDLLEPMTTDGKNFVRQGALVAQAMICIQQSEAKNPLVRVGPRPRPAILCHAMLPRCVVLLFALGTGALSNCGCLVCRLFA